MLFELIANPETVIPLVGGLSLIILSEILGRTAALAGMTGFLFGIGVLATRFLFKLDEVANYAASQIKKEEKDLFMKELTNLCLSASKTKLQSPRNTTANRISEVSDKLNSVYEAFSNERDGVSNEPDIVLQTDEMFHVALSNMKKAIAMFVSSKKIAGNTKTKINKQIGKIVDEIDQSIDKMVEVTGELASIKINGTTGDLEQLRQTLSIQLAASKRVEEIMNTNDLSRFSEYEPQ